jgi:hypothetical protein
MPPGRPRTAQAIVAQRAFTQNLHRGHYELGLDAPPKSRLTVKVQQAPADPVNVSRRPWAGTRQIVFDLALRRWHLHAAGQDGWCTAPLCRLAWPCPAVTDAAQVTEDCLTYWARLNHQPRIGAGVTDPWCGRTWWLLI